MSGAALEHPAAARIIGLYERHALAWDRLRGRDLFEKAWLGRFLALLPDRARILDLGCGSGEPIARHLIEAGHAVTGVDSSPAMISLCRSRFPAETWMVADMRSLSLDQRFDGILAWNSFFHLARDEQRRMFRVVQRHAADRAALMFTSGPTDGEAIGTFQGEPLYHASLDSAEYRTLLDGAGFRVVSHLVEDPDCGRHTVWLARHEDTGAMVP
jgi:SAM-dependent methyltransferase